jgi:HemY protein
MFKLLFRLGLLLAAGLAVTWLANRPGTVTINWLGKDITMSVLVATAILAITMAVAYIAWRLLSKLWLSPKTAKEYWRFRQHRKAHESLHRGLIAASAGDSQQAHRHASFAAKALPKEPLAHLLQAQAAQLHGDRAAVKTAFEEMAKLPATELLGLRGLFTESRQTGDLASAVGYAEKALALNPRLAWASTAMLQIQSARKDWSAAAITIASQSKSGLLPKADAAKKRATLLAAQAIAEEETDRTKALRLASDALHLEPSLVPAALVAARCYIAEKNTRKAIRILRDTWNVSPHCDLAQLLAHVKQGDGPEDRFERIRDLISDPSANIEAGISLARAAIAAKRWDVARKALESHIQNAPQARICVAMAEIEEGLNDAGRAREWFARAVTAPRDPMWVSDGVASPRWTPISPVTGEISPSEWKVPFETLAAAPAAAPEIPAAIQLNLPAETPTTALPPPPDDPGVEQ